MRKPMRCKLCGKNDNSNCDISVYQNIFSGKPSAKIYPTVNNWNSQYVFLCNDCYHKLTGINTMLSEPYEPLDEREAEINLDDFTMRLNCNT